MCLALPAGATGAGQPAAAATATAEPDRSAAAAPWQKRLDRIVGSRDMGVSVRVAGSSLYNRRAKKQRIPASNQKLLMAMALFDRVDPESRLVTKVVAETVTRTTVEGDLWLIGGGDPSVTGGGAFARALPYRQFTNRRSSKCSAEMLGKLLATAGGARRGSIAGGAEVVERRGADRGATVTAYDASGLSFANRVSTLALATLLDDAASRADAARNPRRWRSGHVEKPLSHDQGQSQDRLAARLLGVVGLRLPEGPQPVGVFLDPLAGNAEWRAAAIEDKIVELLEERAR